MIAKSVFCMLFSWQSLKMDFSELVIVVGRDQFKALLMGHGSEQWNASAEDDRCDLNVEVVNQVRGE